MCSPLVILFLSRLLSYSSKILNAMQTMSSARVELLATTQTDPVSVRGSPKHKVNSLRIAGTMLSRCLTTQRRHIRTVRFNHQMFTTKCLHHLMQFFGIWISDLPCHPNFKTEFDQDLGFFHPTTKGISRYHQI